MPIGRRVEQPGYDARRAILGVVAWILVLLAGYWLVTDWQSLPRLVNEVMTTIH
jgi:hypothetical protein